MKSFETMQLLTPFPVVEPTSKRAGFVAPASPSASECAKMGFEPFWYVRSVAPAFTRTATPSPPALVLAISVAPSSTAKSPVMPSVPNTAPR